MDNKEVYLLEGIHYIPRILELVDRNRLSPTYGCFDRSFWHYRTSDYPSGMYQECVLPLALAYITDHPKNNFYREDRLKELIGAGIDYARRSSHPDGSCDDYFPYERAAGAAAFSLYACTEACLLLNWKDSSWVEFFKIRGRYLFNEGYNESGVLSNHKALMALTLYNVYLLTQDEKFKEWADQRINDLLSLQDEEGWFPEYEGCDPGYLTFTIDFLAKYYQKSKAEKLIDPLKKAIEFSSHFMHPDGSYGGEYGSRNTFHFLPHGFELMGEQVPEGIGMAERFIQAVQGKRRSYPEDDRIFSHYVYNYLQAYRDFCTPRRVKERPYEFSKFFKNAGLFIKSSGNDYSVISLKKGGVGKIFKNGILSLSDCGLAGRTQDGREFISQCFGDFQWEFSDGKLMLQGPCYEHWNLLFSPSSFLLFRLFLSSVGRFLPANFTRRLLQKRVITKSKKKFPLRFVKTLSLEPTNSIEYVFQLEDPSIQIKELWIPSDAAYIYVATSHPYQPGNLKAWIDLSGILPELNQKRNASFRLPIL